jgi:tRNA-uridine 2-sulfurtransferase
MRVLVAMSGGVDSAVAAARLVADGHDVEGVTLRLADLSSCGLSFSRCCSPGDVERAARTCWQLGIGHRVLEVGQQFRTTVVDPFVRAYLAGLTPSPCPRCNSAVKLGPLIDLARTEGFAAVASGHYAVSGAAETGEPALWAATHPDKDQSYFLFELTAGHLAGLLLPLGDLPKADVRAQAKALGLPSAGEPDSQEVCFVPRDGSYLDVLEALAGDRLPPVGEIVDVGGRLLGSHAGIHHFTIGQRRGLRIAGHQPLYVVAIEARENRVVVGPREALLRRRLLLHSVNWLVPDPAWEVEALVKVRARHDAAPAVVRRTGVGAAEVDFRDGVSAPAPGQAAVFYSARRVLGGGWIEAAG